MHNLQKYSDSEEKESERDLGLFCFKLRNKKADS